MVLVLIPITKTKTYPQIWNFLTTKTTITNIRQNYMGTKSNDSIFTFEKFRIQVVKPNQLKPNSNSSFNLVLDLFWILGFHYFSSFRCAIGTMLLFLLRFPIILHFSLFTLFFNHEPMSSSFSISFIFSCLSLTFI